MKDKYLTIKIIAEKGRLIQKLFPLVRDFYTSGIDVNSRFFRLGFTAKDIADIIYSDPNLIEALGIRSKSVLENAIRYSLKGNQDPLVGETYQGILSQEKYSFCSNQNRFYSGEIVSLNSKQNKKGALFQTKEQLQDAARKAAIARGQRPWETEEIQEAYLLRQEGKSAKQLGEILGRSRYGVLEMFRREERKCSKR